MRTFLFSIRKRGFFPAPILEGSLPFVFIFQYLIELKERLVSKSIVQLCREIVSSNMLKMLLQKFWLDSSSEIARMYGIQIDKIQSILYALCIHARKEKSTKFVYQVDQFNSILSSLPVLGPNCSAFRSSRSSSAFFFLLMYIHLSVFMMNASSPIMSSTNMIQIIRFLQILQVSSLTFLPIFCWKIEVAIPIPSILCILSSF